MRDLRLGFEGRPEPVDQGSGVEDGALVGLVIFQQRFKDPIEPIDYPCWVPQLTGPINGHLTCLGLVSKQVRSPPASHPHHSHPVISHEAKQSGRLKSHLEKFTFLGLGLGWWEKDVLCFRKSGPSIHPEVSNPVLV